MEDKILTLAQAAEQLGVSQRTLLRFMDADQIRGFRIGTRWKFMQSEVDAYLKRQQEQSKKKMSEAMA